MADKIDLLMDELGVDVKSDIRLVRDLSGHRRELTAELIRGTLLLDPLNGRAKDNLLDKVIGDMVDSHIKAIESATGMSWEHITKRLEELG